MKLFDATLTKLETSLDLRLDRHNLLASNVANANTPDFTPRDFDFARAMSQAENSLSSAPSVSSSEVSLGARAPGAAEAPGTAGAEAAGVAAEAANAVRPAGFDGNRVNADQAMVSLAENAMQYGASAQAANKKLAILLYAASDGS